MGLQRRFSRRGILALGSALALSGLYAACGTDEDGSTGGGPTSTPTTPPVPTPTPTPTNPPAATAIAYPTGEKDVVIRYEIEGGFVPLEFYATNMPLFTLYGDGYIITPGAQIEIFRQPALPPLTVQRVSPEGMQMILDEAQSSGLLEGEQTWDELSNFVADAGTGVLTIQAGGDVHRIAVYAPGMTDLEELVSPDEIEFRQNFDAFVANLTNITGWLPESVFLAAPQEYPAHALQLIVQPAELSPFSDPSIEPDHIEWPLETPIADLGEPSFLPESRCIVLTGDEFAKVMSLLSDATTITRWDSDGESYVFYVRPLLRDEEGCSNVPFE